MPPARKRSVILPRVLRRFEISSYLGHSETWFVAKRGSLEKIGFPKFNTLLDGYDKDAVDLWLDSVSGLSALEQTKPLMAVNAWEKAAGHGNG